MLLCKIETKSSKTGLRKLWSKQWVKERQYFRGQVLRFNQNYAY